MGFGAGQRAERGAALERPRKHAPMRAPEGRPRARAGSVLWALRLGGGGPPAPRPWSLPCMATRTPLSPPVAKGPTLEKWLRFPASRAPQGLRIELSKLAGRGFVRRAARGERRTRKMASGARGLGSRGAAEPRGAAGGAGRRCGSRTPRSAASTTSRGRGALSSRRVSWQRARAGRQRCREREVIFCGGRPALFPPGTRTGKAFLAAGELWIFPPGSPSPGFYLPKSRSARLSLALFEYLPLQGD